MTPPGVTFHQWGPDQAADHADHLVTLHDRAFAEAPYNEGPEQRAAFRERLPAELTAPGAQLVCAFINGQIVGGAYGFTMPAGRWWTNTLNPPPADLSRHPKLAVIEWAVDPDYRRRGIGGRLMHDLLARRPEPLATLNAFPGTAAHTWYLHNGWRINDQTRAGTFPSLDVLTLVLPSHASPQEGDA